MIKFMTSLPNKYFKLLPENEEERNDVIFKAVKYWFNLNSHLAKIGGITSEKKAASSKENGKKGGRPRKPKN